MASDSSEPTRRKHRRSSSPDDADKRSKRRKHRHHHRHRSKKDREETTKREEGGIDEVEVEERKVDCDVVNKQDGGAAVLSTGGFAGVDYDMEEGEIVEDDNDCLVNYVNGDIEKKMKSLDSDVESGEIDTYRYDHSITGVTEDIVKNVDMNNMDLENGIVAVKEGGKLDRITGSSSERLANGDYVYKYHKDENRLLTGDVKRDCNPSDEVEQGHRLKNLSFEKRHKAVTRSHSQDKYLKDGSPGHLPRSPEPSRGRSRSRSIVRDASILGILQSVEDPGNVERKHGSDSDDERMIAQDTNYRHGRDDVRDKDRERSSSRYVERMVGQYSRESRDRYRGGSRDRDWDRTREKERKMERERERERERTRLRDRGDKERERGRERTVDRDKEMESEKDRDRERARRERVREERDMEKYSGRDGGRGRSKYKDRDAERDRLSRRQKYDDEDGHRDKVNDNVRRRKYEDENMKSERSDLENVNSKNNSEERDRDRGNLKREEDGQEDYNERISIQLAEQEEDDLERVKEESRRRTQAIMEKHKKQHAQQNETQSKNMVKEQVQRSSEQVASAQSTAENFDSQVEGTDVNVAGASLAVGKSPLQNGLVFKMPAGTGELGEGTPKSERSDDMFCDDIFGESPAEMRKTGKGDGLAIDELHDNWDDAEGYYGYRFGEILDIRYEIIAAQGKGVFSTVVRAKDLKAKPGDPEEVAIKIIRNNETMYKAGMEELIILKKLVDADPENKRHCVRFLSNFKYRNHLCLVFESLHMNLREVLKKFGRNIGLKLTAVRTYAKQLFIALKHLKNCGVLHCDIKPDNMLVNEAKNVLKLCDFGNAMFAGKNEITPYLVSRFYRAPEIILGLPYDHPMDIWSVGCCLFEIYSGKVLFPGPSNNDMLRLHMELKGPFPKKMLRKGAFTDQHFDQDLNFLAIEDDPVTKKAVRRLMVNIKPKDFGTLISGSPGEDPKMLANFKDLLEKIFALDPDKRLNVSQALSHPFITGK